MTALIRELIFFSLRHVLQGHGGLRQPTFDLLNDVLLKPAAKPHTAWGNSLVLGGAVAPNGVDKIAGTLVASCSRLREESSACSVRHI